MDACGAWVLWKFQHLNLRQRLVWVQCMGHGFLKFCVHNFKPNQRALVCAPGAALVQAPAGAWVPCLVLGIWRGLPPTDPTQRPTHTDTHAAAREWRGGVCVRAAQSGVAQPYSPIAAAACCRCPPCVTPPQRLLRLLPTARAPRLDLPLHLQANHHLIHQPGVILLSKIRSPLTRAADGPAPEDKTLGFQLEAKFVSAHNSSAQVVARHQIP